MTGWTTAFGDDVQVGHLVSICHAQYPDAIGLIVGPTPTGKIDCDLITTHAGKTGTRVSVDASQLLTRVWEGGHPVRRNDYDHLTGATPFGQPETEKDNEATDDTAAEDTG